MPRTGRRALLPGALTVLPWAAPRQAAAHAVVTASEPEAGAALAESPARVSVRFNSRIDHGRSRLVLVGPEGVQHALDLAPAAEPTLLVASVPAAPLVPGAWRLRWQVLAVDGHITRGDIPFTLRAKP
jgi:methionine-rich copper-binding protein CopC